MTAVAMMGLRLPVVMSASRRGFGRDLAIVALMEVARKPP
jgi:hypothetical protein